MKLKWGKKTPEAIRLDDDKMTAEAVALEAGLAKNVIDQDRAIKQFVRAYEVWQTGLNPPDKPLANLLFLGPTGVGKTHLVEVFCDELWGAHDMLLKVDCSEYQHSHETAKLIGSPPGYVGYNTGAARLSQEALEGHWRTSKGPKISVILFDEIEKAHSDVWNMLLQILEEGKLTDSMGRIVNFRNTIILMTSNVGSDTLKKSSTMGFAPITDESSYEKARERVLEEAKKTFRPEFLNRLDDLIVFRSFTKPDLIQILSLEVEKVLERLRKKNLRLELDEKAKDFLVEKGYDPQYGARPMRRAVERFFEDPLAEEILKGVLSEGGLIQVTAGKDKLVFSQKAAAAGAVAS